MLDLPIDELKYVGQKLQQSLMLTRLRTAEIKNPRLKARTARTLHDAGLLFDHLSNTVMASSRLLGFMEKLSGMSVNDMFAATGHERVATGATFIGIELVNDAVRKTINRLAAVNADIDKEVKQNEKT